MKYLDSPNTALANLNLAKQLISYQESDAAAKQLPQTQPENRTLNNEPLKVTLKNCVVETLRV